MQIGCSLHPVWYQLSDAMVKQQQLVSADMQPDISTPVKQLWSLSTLINLPSKQPCLQTLNVSTSYNDGKRGYVACLALFVVQALPSLYSNHM